MGPGRNPGRQKTIQAGRKLQVALINPCILVLQTLQDSVVLQHIGTSGTLPPLKSFESLELSNSWQGSPTRPCPTSSRSSLSTILEPKIRRSSSSGRSARTSTANTGLEAAELPPSLNCAVSCYTMLFTSVLHFPRGCSCRFLVNL